MAGSARSETAAWSARRPDEAPVGSGPHFARGPSPQANASERTTHRFSTRPFRFGSEVEADPDAPLEPGARIGERHRVVRLLGEGGMGRVYEAEHVVLERRVAIKLLRSDAAASPDSLARFQQEALAASRIGAPQIVEVLDFASHVGVAGRAQTYMVMELLVGDSLEAWMDRPGSLREGVAYLAELCEGLAAAHGAGVIHRDIKPANVFIRRPEPARVGQVRVKILDFGIAKVTAVGSEAGFQTQQGSLLGTPYYLAPERVLGEPLTPAADLYSVGVILYEMLVGDVPFVAESFMGVLARHVQTHALDPRQAAPERGIPDAIATTCMRLLSKRASERGSAEQVAAELRGLVEREGASLARVVTGPRERSTSTGPDTQVFATTDVHARPTAPPRTGVIARPALASSSVSAPTAPTSPTRRWPLALVGALVLALGLGLAARRLFESADVANADADAAENGVAKGGEPSEPPVSQASLPVAEAPVPEVPVAEPEPAPTLALEGAGPAPTSEASSPSPNPKPSSGKRGANKPASTPEPAQPEPAQPEPAPEQPEPAPTPKPIEDDRVPTIKDDIYD